MNILLIIITLLLFFLYFSFIYILFYYKYDKKNILENYTSLREKYKTDKINDLLNGSSINNIPNLKINTPNAEISNAQMCSIKPHKVSSLIANNEDCAKFCLNSSAVFWQIDETQNVIFDNKKLDSGNYCSIAARPNCNMKTTIAIMTINSVVCHPKEPKIFGGPYGNTIVACNNSEIYDPLNILFDFKENLAVNPYTIPPNFDKDEKLSPGTYRYRCVFKGTDDRDNYYIENPYDRFQPIENKCADLLYRAHPDVKPRFGKDSYTCYCGKYQETRVRNLNANDPTSKCSPYQNKYNVPQMANVNDKSLYKTTLIYDCFTINSPITDILTKRPCPPEKFTRQGVNLDFVEVEYATNENALIEHPMYKYFAADSKSGVWDMKEVRE